MKNQKKLFSNVGGNQFKLLTESIETNYDKPPGTDLVREGLKKVFSNGSGEISYKRLQNVGLGYIKDVTQATKCALREAKEMAGEFGYKDDESNEKFVKEEESHDETDMSNTEEKREVQIGKEIINLTGHLQKGGLTQLSQIRKLAQELIQMHGGNDKNKPLSGWDTLQLKSH